MATLSSSPATGEVGLLGRPDGGGATESSARPRPRILQGAADGALATRLLLGFYGVSEVSVRLCTAN